MPGLIGFVLPGRTETGTRRLERMARDLEPDARFRRDLHIGEGFGLGRVSLGILNPAPQPAWSRDRTLGAMIDGELFDTDRLHRDVGGDPAGTDAELILRLYSKYGEGFAERLNGAFAVAIWDGQGRRLILASDRLGLHPLYFARVKDGLIFGAGVRALLGEPGLSRRLDRVAMAEFLTFDHVLGQRTLLSEVELMPQGTLLIFQRGRLHLRPYWRPIFPTRYPVRKDAAYSDDLVDLLRQAILRQCSDPRPAAVLLSGGLDSRTLLAGMAELPRRERLSTLTWGIPGSDDERYARQASRLARFPHHAIPLHGNWLATHAAEGVRISDGMGNLVNLPALAAAEASSRYAPVLYKGFLGDAMFGFGMRPRHWAEYDDASLVQAHLEAYRDYDVLSFDLPAHPRLFSRGFRRAVGDGIVDDYRKAIQAAGSSQLSDQRLYIDLAHRVPRMTLNGVEAVRGRAAVRMPFADNDLLEFSLRVPPGLRLGRQVMVQSFIRAFPDYAQIPFTPSGLPLMACARDVLLRGRHWAQWHLRRNGLGWLAGPTARPVKDYAAWFRGVLRAWVEEILLSPASLDRGYFQPEAVRSIVTDHMAGTNHAVRLGALLTLELWHRQFVD